MSTESRSQANGGASRELGGATPQPPPQSDHPPFVARTMRLCDTRSCFNLNLLRAIISRLEATGGSGSTTWHTIALGFLLVAVSARCFDYDSPLTRGSSTQVPSAPMEARTLTQDTAKYGLMSTRTPTIGLVEASPADRERRMSLSSLRGALRRLIAKANSPRLLSIAEQQIPEQKNPLGLGSGLQRRPNM